LAYTFNERVTDKAHIREIVRKAKRVWGIRKRKWEGDFRKRMMMFESVLMYGAEIWEWKKEEKV
jgi:hypothetical protein